MYKSKLFSFIKAFLPKEWKHFRNFLKCSVGESSEVYRLYRHIEEHKNKLDAKNLEIDHIRIGLFNGISRKAVLNVMSKLKSEIETFWTLEELKENKLEYDLYRLRALNKREFYKDADKIGDHIREVTSCSSRINLWDQYYKLAANHERYFSYNPIKNTDDGSIALKESIGSTIEFSNLLALYYRVEAINREDLYHEDWAGSIQLIDLYTNDIDASILAEILKHLNLLLQENSDNSFSFLNNVLFDNQYQFSEALNVTLYIHIKDFLTKSIQNGNVNRIEVLAELINNAILQKKMVYRDHVATGIFNNSVSVLCSVKKFDNATEIINIVAPQLPKEKRRDLVHLAQQNVRFYRGLYDDLIDNFNKFKFDHPVSKLTSFPKVLMSTYLLRNSDFEFMNYQVRNYRDYLNRHKEKISANQYRGQINFLVVFKLLVEQKEHSVVKKKIESLSPLYYRIWLSEQINEEAP